VNEQCFLGLHRLAVTDVNAATQIFSRNGVQLLFNGEIYNYKILAKELGLQVENEIEVLYAAYVKWGDDFVTFLRGMFAIAIIEKTQVKLFRDPFGKKPL
jgi:asparagine synthase (glutamine-hydrolysing)